MVQKIPPPADVCIAMFVKEISIKNFRLFAEATPFRVTDLNVPNDINPGSGLNVFVAENGCGKSSLLDAIAMPFLEYKADTVTIDDFYSKDANVDIKILADAPFNYNGTVPRVVFKSKGFEFEARVRAREAASYLSSVVVKDTRFIRADGETVPEDGKPDLRLKVDNPWSGSRFSENDVLFLDKNRTFQIRSGTYNTTRFDRLMGDFNYKYIKGRSSIADIDDDVTTAVTGDENTFLENALNKFKEVCGHSIKLNLINNYAPFKNAFFGLKRDNFHQVPIKDIGSGYEMVFTLLYSYYLAEQTGKKLILLIDEPELHLHPKLQGDFADLLLEFSKDSQIFITTHSPLFVKQIMNNDKVLIKILVKDGAQIRSADPADAKLSYVSANEVNYIAFALPTEEYHNELYEELKDRHAPSQALLDFDINYFQKTNSLSAQYPYNGVTNKVSLHTHVRNQIHHRAQCGKAAQADIDTSIIQMRTFL